jgi:hypothetical protein
MDASQDMPIRRVRHGVIERPAIIERIGDEDGYIVIRTAPRIATSTRAKEHHAVHLAGQGAFDIASKGAQARRRPTGHDIGELA